MLAPSAASEISRFCRPRWLKCRCCGWKHRWKTVSATAGRFNWHQYWKCSPRYFHRCRRICRPSRNTHAACLQRKDGGGRASANGCHNAVPGTGKGDKMANTNSHQKVTETGAAAGAITRVIEEPADEVVTFLSEIKMLVRRLDQIAAVITSWAIVEALFRSGD